MNHFDGIVFGFRQDMKKLHNILPYILSIAFCIPFFSNAQTPKDTAKRKKEKLLKKQTSLVALRYDVIAGDTIAVHSLPMVRVTESRIFKNKRERRRYRRLERNVKKVYPYAKLASVKLKEYEAQMIDVKNKARRKRMMKEAEEELKAEFEDELRRLTFSQGKLLLKLIDRETGDSTYEIIEELRGKLSAFFWQTIAVFFDADLKAEYDPEGNDEMIEEIVLRIERGEL